MDPKIRRAALRAAAKTAIALSLTGATLGLSACTSSHSPPAMGDAAREISDAAVVVMMEDAAVARPDAASPACEPLLASLELAGTEDLWTTRFASDEARNDVRTGECCMELEVRAEGGGGADIDPAVGMACCEVIVSVQRLQPFSNLGCTPWGPPCPPEAPV